jgi:hypothetical protein
MENPVCDDELARPRFVLTVTGFPMFNVRHLFIAAALTVAAIQPAAAQPRLGVIGGINDGGLAYGVPPNFEFTRVTNSLNAAFGGAANVTILANAENASAVLGFDALWIDLRNGSNSLSSLERTALGQFITSGKRVIFMGENQGFRTWNNSFLTLVGGSATTTNISGPLTVAAAAATHPLTQGLTGLRTASAGQASGGTALFSENVATLWGAQQNVLTYLDASNLRQANWNGSLPGGLSNDGQFGNNMSAWLAAPATVVPEPATYAMLGMGLVTLAALSRRKRQAA